MRTKQTQTEKELRRRVVQFIEFSGTETKEITGQQDIVSLQKKLYGRYLETFADIPRDEYQSSNKLIVQISDTAFLIVLESYTMFSISDQNICCMAGEGRAKKCSDAVYQELQLQLEYLRSTLDHLQDKLTDGCIG